MKVGLLLASLALLGSGAVLAQDSDGSRAALRQRIEAEQRAQAAALDAQTEACNARFAVTPCKNAVDVRRRSQETVFRQQLADLDLAERQEQAQATRERLAARQQQHDAALASKAAPPAARSSQAQPPTPQGSARAPAPAKDGAPGISLQQQLANRKAYQSKQEAAQQRLRARDQRLRQAGSSSAQLPDPP